MQFVPTAARNARFHSNRTWISQCTVKDAGRRGEEKEKEEIGSRQGKPRGKRRKPSRRKERKEAIAQEEEDCGHKGREKCGDRGER